MIMVVVDRLTKMRHYIPCTAREADKALMDSDLNASKSHMQQYLSTSTPFLKF